MLPYVKVYTSNAHKETTKHKMEKRKSTLIKTPKQRVGNIKFSASKATEDDDFIAMSLNLFYIL